MGFWRRIVLVWVGACGRGMVGAQAPKQDEPLRVTTQLVVLDATVLDKAGHVVTQPLTRDDFLIEENKKPQEIYSFESAAEHSAAAASGEAEKSPKLIFVLDELNYAYQPFPDHCLERDGAVQSVCLREAGVDGLPEGPAGDVA